MKDIIIAVIPVIGTLIGSFLGVIASQKLVDFRLKQLEAKQDKHNAVIERTYKLEGAVTELQHDVRDIKQVIHIGGRDGDKS